MSSRRHEKPTPDSVGIDITPLQYVLHQLINGAIIPTHPTLYHSKAKKAAIIYTEYERITPEMYGPALMSYFTSVMKVLACRGIEPVDMEAALMTIRYGTAIDPYHPETPILHFVCIPTFAIRPLTDDVLVNIKKIYTDHFVVDDEPLPGMDVVAQALDFVLTFTGPRSSAWNLLATKPAWEIPSLVNPVPTISSKLTLFSMKFEDLLQKSTFVTASFYMLVADHNEDVYRIVMHIVNELIDPQNVKKIANLALIDEAINVGHWRLLREDQATNYCNALIMYESNDEVKRNRAFTGLVIRD